MPPKKTNEIVKTDKIHQPGAGGQNVTGGGKWISFKFNSGFSIDNVSFFKKLL